MIRLRRGGRQGAVAGVELGSGRAEVGCGSGGRVAACPEAFATRRASAQAGAPGGSAAIPVGRSARTSRGNPKPARRRTAARDELD